MREQNEEERKTNDTSEKFCCRFYWTFRSDPFPWCGLINAPPILTFRFSVSVCVFLACTKMPNQISTSSDKIIWFKCERLDSESSTDYRANEQRITPFITTAYASPEKKTLTHTSAFVVQLIKQNSEKQQNSSNKICFKFTGCECCDGKPQRASSTHEMLSSWAWKFK